MVLAYSKYCILLLIVNFCHFFSGECFPNLQFYHIKRKRKKNHVLCVCLIMLILIKDCCFSAFNSFIHILFWFSILLANTDQVWHFCQPTVTRKSKSKHRLGADQLMPDDIILGLLQIRSGEEHLLYQDHRDSSMVPQPWTVHSKI